LIIDLIENGEKMKMEKFCILALLITIIGVNILSISAAPQDQLDNITDTTKDALNNASEVANETAAEVNSFLDPIQSILNAINSVLQEIQQILYFFSGGQ